MPNREILLLGNEKLYKTSKKVEIHELDKAKQIIDDLHDTIVAFRDKYGYGRAIAAPQIDEAYRIVYMNLGSWKIHFINPVMEPNGEETFELWDDCMSFPGLEVWVKRYKKVVVKYKDLDWKDCELTFDDELAELFQHEYDHLDGILAVQRAVDQKAFRINKEKSGKF